MLCVCAQRAFNYARQPDGASRVGLCATQTACLPRYEPNPSARKRISGAAPLSIAALCASVRGRMRAK